MPNLITCPCQNCSGHLQFDAATLSKENNKITCPHCGLETILFVPPPTDAKMQTILSPHRRLPGLQAQFFGKFSECAQALEFLEFLRFFLFCLWAGEFGRTSNGR